MPKQRLEVMFTGKRTFGSGLALTWVEQRLESALGTINDLELFALQLERLADHVRETINNEGLPPE
jgi:hypothetical protein